MSIQKVFFTDIPQPVQIRIPPMCITGETNSVHIANRPSQELTRPQKPPAYVNFTAGAHRLLLSS